MVSKNNGSLFYFGGRILLATKGLNTDAHSHYAVSVLISLDVPFQLTHKNGITTEHMVTLIPPNYFHTLNAETSEMIVLQFDPKSSDFDSFKQKCAKYEPTEFKWELIQKIIPNLKSLLAGNLNCESALELYYKILNCLGGDPIRQNPLDKRMETVLNLIESTLPESISVSSLSKRIGISEDRFMHWFKEEFGIPLRQYLLWRRLHIAANLLQKGTNLTEASHAAGFADQSHLSKTFRKMFGVPPSKFLGQSEHFKVCFCNLQAKLA